LVFFAVARYSSTAILQSANDGATVSVIVVVQDKDVLSPVLLSGEVLESDHIHPLNNNNTGSVRRKNFGDVFEDVLEDDIEAIVVKFII
jgi:hypothetical protein